MARLNEAPLPTESIDALKRRFIRQNRELAKNNSAQCLRIRALECEVSRLLAENLDFREEILRLQTDLTAAQSHVGQPAVISVKDQLEAKLREFGALVSELGNLQGPPASRSGSTSAKRDSDPSSWRPSVPVAALSGQSCRLSEIIEEQASPGGTFHNNNVRIKRLSDQSNESPDLGPPPIAHFECEDPIKFDPTSQIATEAVEESNDNDEIPASLSVNLETRRKRRETHAKFDVKSAPSLNSEHNNDAITVRPSSKRKLDMRDAEENDVEPTRDDFVFSRRTSVGGDAKKASSNAEPVGHPTEAEAKAASNHSKLLPQTERKVLGNKSVNTSPRKASASKTGKDNLDKPDRSANESRRGQGRERKPRTSINKPLQSSEPLLHAIELPPPEAERSVSAPPKTPAADFFSPTASEASGSRPDGRDTPPPSGLNPASSTSSALNGASRPSRRARAAVNYAEPNLISKMRRPGKELADAVALAARQSARDAAELKSKQMRTVTIKQEESSARSHWKGLAASTDVDHSEPGSPLGGKGIKLEEPDAPEDMDAEVAPLRPSASGRAIAALMANKPQSKDKGAEDMKAKLEETTSKMQEMDLYDFKDSSPAGPELARAAPKSSSRRHSSISGSMNRDVTRRRASKAQQQLSEKTGGETQTLETEGAEAQDSTRSERSTARRRSMMV